MDWVFGGMKLRVPKIKHNNKVGFFRFNYYFRLIPYQDEGVTIEKMMLIKAHIIPFLSGNLLILPDVQAVSSRKISVLLSSKMFAPLVLVMSLPAFRFHSFASLYNAAREYGRRRSGRRHSILACFLVNERGNPAGAFRQGLISILKHSNHG